MIFRRLFFENPTLREVLSMETVKKFWKIVTHRMPHIDEIWAILLLRMFGEKVYPGISQAEIEFCDPGFQEKTAKAFEEEGILLIGVGGGDLDEHAPMNGVRKKGECAATLVAEALGLSEDPALEKVTDYVAKNDLHGGGGYLSLPHTVKLLYEQNPEDPMVAINFATQALMAAYFDQLIFLNEARKEFEKAVIEHIEVGDNTLTIVTIESDNGLVNKYARSRHGAEAAVVIQKRSSGHMSIFTNRYHKVNLCDVVRMIRLLEQRAKGAVLSRGFTLKNEGVVVGAEEWYFDKSLRMLTNGGPRATKIPPSKLPLKIVRATVKAGLNEDYFPDGRAVICRAGTCTSRETDPCPLWEFGLPRCIRIQKI